MAPTDPKDGRKDWPDDDSSVDPELLRRSKVSSHLRAQAINWERRRRDKLEGKSDEPVPLVAPTVKALIQLKGPDTSELERTGIPFTHLFDFYYSAEPPLDRLDDLAGLDTVLRVHHEPKMRPMLDDSIPEIRASTVRNPQHPFSGTNKYTGLGVIIGIIDDGINILHPVFRLPNDQTKTRIRAILDQTVFPPKTFDKGQIEAAIASNTQVLSPSSSGVGDHKHGTHVAGIAAGNGKKAGNCSGEFTYVGVAPEAEIVVVKHDFSGPTSLLAAIVFIVNTARAIPTDGVPCVINMSFGFGIGPHDGTDPTDRMIDRFLTTPLPPPVQPVVLVAAAGNEGAPGFHSAGSIPPGGVAKRLRFELHSEKSTGFASVSRVTISFTAPNGLGCRLIPPGDDTSGGSNLAPPDGIANFVENRQNSTCSVMGSPVAGGPPGKRQIDIEITSSNTGKNQPGEWVIELTNAGPAAIPYHAWIEGHQCDQLLDDLVRANTISSPGSAAEMITVGNYASSGKNKGKLAPGSSRGPRPDGLLKPDISAPGEKICSAKRDLHTGCCCDCCCSSYIDMKGTSMAAPHVTGAIALMLERNPALTHQQIKGILIANARRDSFTGTTANNDFGAGKLDVIALLNDPAVRQGGAVLASAGAASPVRTRPDDIAAAAARGLPALPQLQEGTPLWRLLNTEEGKRLYRLGRLHWEEARALVNSHKRVATVWHRNHGPFLLHHVTRTTLLPHVPLPRELDGVEVGIRAARMVSALEPYASKALIQAMHATLPLVSRLQGRTLLELVEMFESTGPQHA